MLAPVARWGRLRVSGIDLVPAQGPLLLVPNHDSQWCVFPEGRLSRGERLRARSGVARLASWCPGVAVVLCAVSGTTDYVRFPRRPRVAVSFFLPQGGQPRAGEEPAELAARLLEEIRQNVPPVPAGRRHREAAASVG